MILALRSALIFTAALLVRGPVQARTWTDSTGKFSIDADLIAADERRAVLEVAKNRLISVDVERLSTADQEYLRAQLKPDERNPSIEVEQIWPTRRGLKMRAKVVGCVI